MSRGNGSNVTWNDLYWIFILLQGRKGMHYIIHKSNLIDALSLDEQVK